MSSVAEGKEEPRASKIPHETVSPVCVCVCVCFSASEGKTHCDGKG